MTVYCHINDDISHCKKYSDCEELFLTKGMHKELRTMQSNFHLTQPSIHLDQWRGNFPILFRGQEEIKKNERQLWKQAMRLSPGRLLPLMKELPGKWNADAKQLFVCYLHTERIGPSPLPQLWSPTISCLRNNKDMYCLYLDTLFWENTPPGHLPQL